MIREGDLVRYSNRYLKVFSTSKRRGRNMIMRVMNIEEERRWVPDTKKGMRLSVNRIATLDVTDDGQRASSTYFTPNHDPVSVFRRPIRMSTFHLRFVSRSIGILRFHQRKKKKKDPQVLRLLRK